MHKWETLEQAAIRESREEAAIEIAALEPMFGMYANFTPHRCDHVALFVSRHRRKIEFRSAEIAEIGFFALDDLPAGTTDATRRRINDFVGRSAQSVHW